MVGLRDSDEPANWMKPVNRMEQVFKAYDVRGTVPDQLDAAMCHAIGRAMARFAGAPESWWPATCASRGWSSPAAFSDGVRSEGVERDRPRPGLDRLPLLRLGPSRRARRHVHRVAQPGPVQRHQALPLGRPPHRARHRPGRDRGRGGEAARTSPRARSTGRPPRAEPARRVGRPRRLLRRRLDACGRSRSWPTRRTAWAAWSCRSSSSGCPSRSTSSSPSSTAPSPTIRPTRSSPRTWSP